jgi:putative membrane protein
MNFLTNLLSFIAYFSGGIVATVIFMLIYTRMTPYNEIALIKDNNRAAAIAFAGSLLGFIIAIASLIEHSVYLMDFALWSVVAILVQLLAYSGVRLLFPRIVERIQNNEVPAAIWLAACSVGAGLLNAASMT